MYVAYRSRTIMKFVSYVPRRLEKQRNHVPVDMPGTPDSSCTQVLQAGDLRTGLH